MPRSNRKRKFIVYFATSADGFIARRDGSVDWLERPRSKGNYGMGAFYRSIDTCVLGRKTYDLSVEFGMAGGYAGKKNFVFSHTLSKAASPKVSIVSEDVSAFAERLRSVKGKDIWLVGGAELVAAFLDCGRGRVHRPCNPEDDRRGHFLGRTTPSRPQSETTGKQEVSDGAVRLHYAVPVKRKLHLSGADVFLLSTVLDHELNQEKKNDSSGSRIRCPLCGWSPRKEDKWFCTCGHQWNTFDTGGVCPACLHQWAETQCLSCSRWSPHSDWYEHS